MREFADDASVHLRIEAQTIKFFFKGEVFARFKKGDDNGLGQNILTQAAMSFIDAERTLPGLPAETAKVEFVWMANDIFTSLERVLVVARDGDRLLWDYEIDAEETGAGTVVPFTPPPRNPPPGPGGNERLVKPKGASKKPETKE
jgi:hypothetical protein